MCARTRIRLRCGGQVDPRSALPWPGVLPAGLRWSQPIQMRGHFPPDCDSGIRALRAPSLWSKGRTWPSAGLSRGFVSVVLAGPSGLRPNGCLGDREPSRERHLTGPHVLGRVGRKWVRRRRPLGPGAPRPHLAAARPSARPSSSLLVSAIGNPSRRPGALARPPSAQLLLRLPGAGETGVVPEHLIPVHRGQQFRPRRGGSAGPAHATGRSPGVTPASRSSAAASCRVMPRSVAMACTDTRLRRRR